MISPAAQPPLPVPFGVSEYTTGPATFEQDLSLFRELGIQNIEVCEGKLAAADPRPQIEQLQATGMKVTSVQPRLHSLFPDGPRPLPAPPAERMSRVAETCKLFGQYFPGTTLVTISGAAPNGDYRLAYQTAAHEYRKAASVAEQHGVRLALEPLNPILMNVDTFVCSLAHARRLIETVDHPAFGLFLDVWHVWEDAAAPEEIATLAGRIFGVHVNDWHTPRAFGDRAIPGQGEIPLLKLLQAIRGTGYAGAYTLEIFSELKLPGSLWADPRKTISESKAAFENLWSQVCA